MKEASTITCFLYPDFLHLLPYPDCEMYLLPLLNALTSFYTDYDVHTKHVHAQDVTYFLFYFPGIRVVEDDASTP